MSCKHRQGRKCNLTSRQRLERCSIKHFYIQFHTSPLSFALRCRQTFSWCVYNYLSLWIGSGKQHKEGQGAYRREWTKRPDVKENWIPGTRSNIKSFQLLPIFLPLLPQICGNWKLPLIVEHSQHRAWALAPGPWGQQLQHFHGTLRGYICIHSSIHSTDIYRAPTMCQVLYEALVTHYWTKQSKHTETMIPYSRR